MQVRILPAPSPNLAHDERVTMAGPARAVDSHKDTQIAVRQANCPGSRLQYMRGLYDSGCNLREALGSSAGNPAQPPRCPAPDERADCGAANCNGKWPRATDAGEAPASRPNTTCARRSSLRAQQAPAGCDLRGIGRSSPGRVFQDCRRTEPVYSGRCKPCFRRVAGLLGARADSTAPCRSECTAPPLAILIGDEG